MATRKPSSGHDEQSLNTDLHMLDLPHQDLPFTKGRDSSPLVPKSYTQNVSRSSIKNGRRMKNLLLKKEENNNIKILVIPSHGSLFQNDPRSSNDNETRSNKVSPKNETSVSHIIRAPIELERSQSATEEQGFNYLQLQERGIKT